MRHDQPPNSALTQARNAKVHFVSVPRAHLALDHRGRNITLDIELPGPRCYGTLQCHPEQESVSAVRQDAEHRKLPESLPSRK